MDWEDLKTFLNLVENGTVRRSADRMGLHHSTVARRLERLEAQLGSRLFDRQPNGLALTDVGETLIRSTSGVTEQIESARRQVSGADAPLTGRVSVSTVPPVAAHVIAPQLAGFAHQHPELHIDLQTTYGFADIAHGAAEIVVRLDNNPSDSLLGKRLFPYFETVYATPDYLNSHKANLGGARWIGYGTAGTGRPGWVEGTPFADTPVWGSISDLGGQVSAAEAGLGFAALPCLVGDRSPRLVRATPETLVAARDIWILTHHDLRRVKRIRVVMQFLEATLRAAKRLLQGEIPQTPIPSGA